LASSSATTSLIDDRRVAPGRAVPVHVDLARVGEIAVLIDPVAGDLRELAADELVEVVEVGLRGDAVPVQIVRVARAAYLPFTVHLGDALGVNRLLACHLQCLVPRAGRWKGPSVRAHGHWSGSQG
jgi:hypothetical protein